MRSLVLVLLFFVCQITLAHKFYMSITDINYNSTSKALEISIKFFTDDLEKALEEKNNSRIFLGTSKEIELTDSLLQSYLIEKFVVKQGGQIKNIEYVGQETEQEYTWAYLELKGYDSESKIWIENSVLIDLFQEQANRINFINNSYTKSVTLHKDLRGAMF